MVNKTMFQGVLLVAILALVFIGLSQIDWLTLFQVEKISQKTEESLGEILYDSFTENYDECNDAYLVNSVDSLVKAIGDANDMDLSNLKLHVLYSDEVNAFALPDDHMVLYTGLISQSENEAELCGVICHELAHIRLNHSTEKLSKEIGLSVLISMSTGHAGAEAAKALMKTLTSKAYDRSLEREADYCAIRYLENARISPRPMGEFFFRLSTEEGEYAEYLSWMSTHPLSNERANYILEASEKNPYPTRDILSENTWEILQERLSELTL